MIKKLLCVTIISTAILTGCNKTILDTTYTFDYAIISLPDGTVVKGEIESWKDYEGEQLQVTIDGVTYLTSSFNCTLIHK